MAMVNQAGWRVEKVTLQPSPERPFVDRLRVSWRGYWQADCKSTEEVAQYVDIASLTPEGWAPAAQARADHRPNGPH